MERDPQGRRLVPGGTMWRKMRKIQSLGGVKWNMDPRKHEDMEIYYVCNLYGGGFGGSVVLYLS